MNRIKRYFQSLDSFVQFLYGAKRRISEKYYLLFRKNITKNIERFALLNIDSQYFSSRIIDLLQIPDLSQTDINELSHIELVAERSVKGIYNILGSGDVILNPIKWHTDFKSGYTWPPGTFYKKYTQEGIDTDSDVKVPRELSRSHHFLKLALSYKVTKEEKFARCILDQMQDWIKENPLMNSINWGCTMDVSIRAVNWIWTLGLISEFEELDQNAIDKIKVSLYQHGWFIYRNPEKEVLNNHNHYLADLTGQIHLGLLFNNLDEPQKWLEKGKTELFHEIRMQILPSGMSYERSTNYNRLVLELILVPVLLLKRQGHEIPSDIWYRLEKMFEFIMYSLKPDGNSPIIGDQDNGRLLPFGCELRNDYRYLLSLGAILYNRADFKQFGNGYNIYCSLLVGEDSLNKWNKIPARDSELGSKAFPDAGIYILRKKDNYLLFNTSGKGMYPELSTGTHTHSDLLSFELVSKGKAFLVDPGSFVYTADAAKRMLFRSTKMHNTLTVDGESQNILRKEMLWDFERNAIPEVINWESDDTHDVITARHTGYARLNKPAIHTRSVTFDKNSFSWLINDELTGEGEHLVEWFFHFDTGIDFIIDGFEARTTCTDKNNIQISFSGIENIALSKQESYVSKGYGEMGNGLVLVASIQSSCPTVINIKINPFTENETNI